MLGQHLLGHEHAGFVQPAQGDDPLSFAEQVRQKATVVHRQAMRPIGQRKADFHRAGLLLHAALSHQASEAECRLRFHQTGGDLRRAVEIQQVLLESVQHQRHSGGDPDGNGHGQAKTAFLAGIHGAILTKVVVPGSRMPSFSGLSPARCPYP